MKQYLVEQVDSLFTTWNRPDSPGCVLGLIQDGELIYSRGYGMANLEYDIPITPSTIFYLASNSKQFTAACIVLLAQKGLISLQDDIHKYFPEMYAYAQPIKVEHLLYHTSGLREHGVLSNLAGLCPLDYCTADSVAMICRQKGVNYPAGETWLYNNAGYVLQSEIVQRVTGQALPLFVQENIFNPLGMKDTIFGDDCTRIIKNRAASYEPDGHGGFRCLLMTNNVLGSAGVMTTVEDLYQWDQNFYNPKVGGEVFIQQMLITGKLNDGRDVGYSAGQVHSEVCGQKAISHSGVEFGYRSIVMRFPEKHFSIICLANLATFTPAVIAEEIAKIFLTGKAAGQAVDQTPTFISPPKSKPNPAPVVPVSAKNEIAGFYFDAQSGAFVELSHQGEQYFAEAMDETIPVTLTKHECSPEKETLTLEFNDPASAVTLKIELMRTKDDWSMQAEIMQCKLPVLRQTEIAKPTRTSLNEYVGTYYSAELKALYEITENDGLLALVNLTGLRGNLKCGPADLFTINGNSLQFTRDPNGQVNGFKLWNLFARGLEFVRFIHV
ncbi:MAG: beta-lactamase family protein [Chloroflexi bacterium]|nr:beta-lactamase family protein [Chloroflexota bacterium]